MPETHTPAITSHVTYAAAQDRDDPQVMAGKAALDAAQRLLQAACRLPGHRQQDMITMETHPAGQTLLSHQAIAASDFMRSQARSRGDLHQVCWWQPAR